VRNLRTEILITLNSSETSKFHATPTFVNFYIRGRFYTGFMTYFRTSLQPQNREINTDRAAAILFL